MFLGITPDNGNLFFTSDFTISKPPLHSFLFVPQAWTLSIELMFYLIAPFILKRGFKFIIIIIIMSFICRLYLFNNLGLQNDPWTYRFFPTEIMFFLFGNLSYRMYIKIKNIDSPRYISKIILLCVIVLTIEFQNLPFIKITYSPFNFFEIIYFLSMIFSLPILFNFSKNSKFDNMIGELSYPIYISHILVITICSAVSVEILKTGWLLAIITIIIAYFLNKIVAVPLEKYRQSRLNKISNTMN
jgi:peptidoglycan/LPS O-acetylase OafA/YrhL